MIGEHTCRKHQLFRSDRIVCKHRRISFYRVCQLDNHVRNPTKSNETRFWGENRSLTACHSRISFSLNFVFALSMAISKYSKMFGHIRGFLFFSSINQTFFCKFSRGTWFFRIFSTHFYFSWMKIFNEILIESKTGKLSTSRTMILYTRSKGKKRENKRKSKREKEREREGP